LPADAASTDLTRRSATELAKAIRDGELSARDVVEGHIEVLERFDPKLNVLVHKRFRAARREAEEVDASVAETADPEELPPLLGVPFTCKESIAVAGLPNCAGVVARRERRAEQTAPAAGRLMEAGAILLGLTNTSELTLWVETENRVYGRTSNPYAPDRTAGGSSGGEAAAIACGGVPLGLGTDFGGSIRLPAFFNGVFGHKPSAGLVSNEGHYPPAVDEADRIVATGPLVRRAEDLAPVLGVLARDDHSRSTGASRIGDPTQVSLDGLRVLLPERATLGPISREVTAAREQAAGALVAAGARVERVPLRKLRRALELYLTVLYKQVGTTLEELLREAGAGRLSPTDFVRRGGPHTVATRLTILAERSGRLVPQWRWRQLLSARDAFVAEIRETIGDGVLLHHSAPKVAPPHGGTVGRLWWVHPMVGFNLAGVPVTQVPLGLNEGGLPLGVQVVVGAGRDHLSIAVALELERVFGGWTEPSR
jgi:fatty acid amide hydrolase 2